MWAVLAQERERVRREWVAAWRERVGPLGSVARWGGNAEPWRLDWPPVPSRSRARERRGRGPVEKPLGCWAPHTLANGMRMGGGWKVVVRAGPHFALRNPRPPPPPQSFPSARARPPLACLKNAACGAAGADFVRAWWVWPMMTNTSKPTEIPLQKGRNRQPNTTAGSAQLGPHAGTAKRLTTAVTRHHKSSARTYYHHSLPPPEAMHPTGRQAGGAAGMQAGGGTQADA